MRLLSATKSTGFIDCTVYLIFSWPSYSLHNTMKSYIALNVARTAHIWHFTLQHMLTPVQVLIQDDMEHYQRDAF